MIIRIPYDDECREWTDDLTRQGNLKYCFCSLEAQKRPRGDFSKNSEGTGTCTLLGCRLVAPRNERMGSYSSKLFYS